MSDSSWLSISIAGVALAQPWVIYCWRRFGKKSTVDAIPSGKLQVLLTLDGPVIGIVGTLSVSKSLVIATCELEVTKEDGTKRIFDAWAFRVRNDNGSERQAYPVAFKVNSESLDLYNMLCSNSTLRDEWVTIVNTVYNRWVQRFSGRVAQVNAARAGNAQPPLDQEGTRFEAEAEYKNFENDQTYILAIRDLDRVLFWTAGSYNVIFRQTAYKRAKSFTTEWKARLSPDLASTIRTFVPRLIFEKCMSMNPPFISILVDYSTEFESRDTGGRR